MHAAHAKPPASPRTITTPVGRGRRLPPVEEPSFWLCATAWDGAITRLVVKDVLLFGLAALAWVVVHNQYPSVYLRVGPLEVAGGAMGAMLVFRNNGGYERWSEGRKLWGSITNLTRALVQAGLAYGPKSARWRQRWVAWCASYPHACRLTLRNEMDTRDFARLLGDEAAQKVATAFHRPSYVSLQVAGLLAEARRDADVSPHFLMNMETARQGLVDAIGACERIATTPLPRLYVFKIRRFMALYLLLLPAGLVNRTGWATPLLTMMVAYSALGLDRIAHELQSPFARQRLNHLPLAAICRAIEANSMGALARADETPELGG